MYIDLESFKFILSLIEDHLIFYNQSTSLQVWIKLQLVVIFYKLMYDRSTSRFLSWGIQLGVSENYINNYIWEVIYILF